MQLKLIAILALVCLSCNNSGTSKEASETTGPVRFDGVYKSEPQSEPGITEKHYYYIRFYQDGRVITVSSSGTPDQIKTWFSTSNENVSRGSYKIEDKHISFSTAYQAVTVSYEGEIESPTRLKLNSTSTNGNKATETYEFTAIPDWK
jgi:hypothetical protein